MHRYEFLTIGQKTDKIFLQSKNTPISFPYKWTKHRFDFLIIGQNTDMIFVYRPPDEIM